MVPSDSRGSRPRIALEICVESAEGAAAAIAGGCDRIELCAALALGGLTPSAGLVAAVLDVARPAGVPVRAMVRPRPGGFDYDAADLALARREAAALLAAGVQGLVFGVTRGGRLDRQALADWRAALPGAPAVSGVPAAPAGLTLHRAIDVVDDPVAAVEEAVALGFDHILTSGGAASAPAGAATIARMVAPAGLIAATGVAAVHGSASEPAAVE
ncbi:MAG: hypothetical protein EOP65_06105, partial [Sphingomonas sp.]